MLSGYESRLVESTTKEGNSLPSEYCAFDSSGALHCLSVAGTTIHIRSVGMGGEFTLQNTPMNGFRNEEWEWQAKGE
ncbi:MAG: hypothetical protein Ct9H90mP16_18580 [Candidatus Poseidoniales archaeon]|nr:MAG: hypothetical protein Ct9H90mP16_18580 [Candidatus Poseidoniales archaeon]